MVKKNKANPDAVDLKALLKKRDLLEADLMAENIDKMLKLEADIHAKTQKFTGEPPTKPVTSKE